MSESDYSEEEAAPSGQAPPPPAPRAAPAAPAASSGGSGAMVGVGIAAAVAVAGAVGYFVLGRGGKKDGPSGGSPAKKRVTLVKSPSRRRQEAGSPRDVAATETGPATSTAAPAPVAAAPSPTRSAGPVLPKRPAAKKPAPKPAPPAAPAAPAAAEEAASVAVAAASQANAAAEAEAAKAAAQAEAARQAADRKAEQAAKQAAEQAAAQEKAAAEAATQKQAAEEAAAKREAAAQAAAAEAAAKQTAAAEQAARETAAAAASAAAAAAATTAAVVTAAAAPAEPAATEAEAPPAEAAAAEPAADAGEEAGEAAPAVVHVLPSAADIAALVQAAEAPAPDADAPAEAIERLADVPAPALSFEGAPADGDLNEVEEKAKKMSLHAHKLVKDNNNLVQGCREQQAALDLLLLPENAGKARPQLVAACAFALSDMLLAQHKVDATRAALAVAYQAAAHIDDRGPRVRALMNFAYLLKAEKKRASAQAAYEEALALAREQHGPLHGMVEKIKYELTAFLGGSGREALAANMLIESAAELLGEAERLEAAGEGGEVAAAPAAEPPAANGAADPPSGLEHIEAEQAAAAEEGEDLAPAQAAQHFAMRNLMNAAGVLDGQQQFERSEALLRRALDIAVCVWGANSMQQLNVMYSLAQHYRRRGMLGESIERHEAVLAIMDETIQEYSPELLQNRISILRDTALLLDQVGQGEAAVDYATGALVNMQTLAGIMQGRQRSTNHPVLEPFYSLLADLKLKVGDESGAAEAKRMANAARLNQRLAQQSKQQQQRAQKGGTGKRAAANGASTARAGGRRV